MNETSLTQLSGQLAGELLRSGAPGYDQARTIWNAMVDHHPAAIVRCADVADVAAAVRTARETGLEIGVRCGGHSVLGLSVPDGGLMIDLSPMGGVTVDPARRLARVQGGALLGALDVAAQAHGLATTAGNVSHTGVGGLTLGGGMGWLARQYGLSCDNVESYELVTATGEIIRASATEHPELYWGLRGGGGNFGIVTEFVFRLHPAGTRALVVELDFPTDRGPEVVAGWRDLNATAPRRATFSAGVGGNGATVTVGYVWVGDPDEGRGLLPALRGLGRPMAERVGELSYVELQTREDAIERHAIRHYNNGRYLRGFPDAAIEAFLLRGTPDGRGEFLPGVGLQAWGGAIAEVGDDDTAFGHRTAEFEWGVGTGWTDPAEDDARLTVARRAAAAMDPYSSGVYVNSLTDPGAEAVRRAYPPAKMARLTRLKAEWDPDNVFHLNANIRPDAA
jgi:FAD/FMN-containing dehydrogenase